jgi:hypothetical protein
MSWFGSRTDVQQIPTIGLMMTPGTSEFGQLLTYTEEQRRATVQAKHDIQASMKTASRSQRTGGIF